MWRGAYAPIGADAGGRLQSPASVAHGLLRGGLTNPCDTLPSRFAAPNKYIRVTCPAMQVWEAVKVAASFACVRDQAVWW